MKYRKKPIVVEAFQMTRHRRWNNEEWPEWLHKAWNKLTLDPGAFFSGFDQERLYLNTLEGEMKVDYGDYIIQGIRGELYPCKPDIFKATYDPVPNEPEEL